MKKFVATYNGRKINVEQINAFKAIRTAAKIFCVKMNKVSVREVK